MKNLIILLFVSLLLAPACSKDDRNKLKEQAIKLISSNTAVVVSASLECGRPDLIEASLAEQLAKLKLLQPELEQESTGNLVCVLAVKSALPVLLGAGLDQIPASWECSGDSAKLKLEELALQACSKIQ